MLKSLILGSLVVLNGLSLPVFAATETVILHCTATTGQLTGDAKIAGTTVGKNIDKYIRINMTDQKNYVENFLFSDYRWHSHYPKGCDYFDENETFYGKTFCEFSPVEFFYGDELSEKGKFSQYEYSSIRIDRKDGSFIMVKQAGRSMAHLDHDMKWTGTCTPSKEPTIKTKF